MLLRAFLQTYSAMEGLTIFDVFVMFPHAQPELATNLIALSRVALLPAAVWGVCAEQAKREAKYRRLLAYMDSEFVALCDTERFF